MTDRGAVELHRDGEGYRVVLNPPDTSRPDAWFAERKEAWGACGGIRLTTGRAKVDLTGEAQ